MAGPGFTRPPRPAGRVAGWVEAIRFSWEVGGCCWPEATGTVSTAIRRPIGILTVAPLIPPTHVSRSGQIGFIFAKAYRICVAVVLVGGQRACVKYGHERKPAGI